MLPENPLLFQHLGEIINGWESDSRLDDKSPIDLEWSYKKAEGRIVRKGGSSFITLLRYSLSSYAPNHVLFTVPGIGPFPSTATASRQ